MDDRGSALILMPAGLLIVVLLGSIAIDLSALHLSQRELSSAAEAAVNDAVTFGLDIDRLRSGDGYHLDPRAVDAAVRRAVAAAHLGPVQLHVEILGSTSVRVTLQREVQLVVAPSLPGYDGTSPIRARATAALERTG